VGELCLDGILGSIKISCWFHLETEKDAFVSTLSKLTGLSHFYEIKLKNTVAINKLIEVAVGMGKRMDTAWIEIITALSQLEKMQVAVLKGEPLQAIDVEEKSDGYVELAPQAQKVSKILETFVNEMQSQNSIILIDKIFTTSVQLSAHSIIHFFTAVCSVSLEEVGMNINGEVITSNPPRMYLLQKIVEIAYYNMHRIRFEWTQIWRILQPHFNIVACHPDIRVANFAVDSLRQMGMKFLEKDELGQFSTQHEYLKSFEFIIKHNNAPVIRELILNSLSQMINARASRIKSGWKSIFVTLVRAAQTDEKLAQSSFKTIQVIFNQHFDEVVSTGAFVDMVSCLAECALLPGQGPVHDELVMSSIQMLQSCTKSLMERAKDQVDDALLPTVRINNLPTQPYLLLNGCISEEHFYLSWFPILSAFSRVVTESDDLLVRTHTMEILFEIFKTSGPLFDAPYWKKISRNIVNPIFDDLNDQEAASARESNSAVLIHGLRLLVSLVSEHFVLFLDLAKAGDSSSTDFLYSCIDRMVELMTKPDDNLASLGQTCFQQFLLLNAAKFDDKTWIWVSSRIEKSFRITMPSELIECDVHGPKDGLAPVEISSAAKKGSTGNVVLLDNLDFGKTVVKCVTHKELLLTIKEFCQLKIANHGAVIAIMPSESRHIILSSLYSSYAIARLFNSMTTLRQAIHKKGWVAQLPNLVDQETISFSTYLQALFQIIKSNDDLEYQESLAKELKDLFQRYIALLKDPERNKQHLRSWGPVVAFNLKELGTVKELWKKDGPLKDSLDEIYRDSVRMTITENHDVRAMLIELLLDIGEIFLTK
jgi:brefeldin A-inhibited guanine nucleotide-exchange protein